MQAFQQLGVCPDISQRCEELGYTNPTPIQQQSIPYALEGRDIIGIAQTGSGKTAAFAIPILQACMETMQPFFALVLSPTRELALQIYEQFQNIGKPLGIKSIALVGGLDKNQQQYALTKHPNIIIGTVGRVLDHLKQSKDFQLGNVKHFVMDEADRLLTLDLKKRLNIIIEKLPQERTTFLFSATMTNKVEKLKTACLKKDAVKIEINQKYDTVDNLTQFYLFAPATDKDCYLIQVLYMYQGNSIIIFTDTTISATRLTKLTQHFGFKSISLFGKLTQRKRLSYLEKFKSKGRNILVATDVASRGLDIPQVDLVINYDIPTHSKNYIHRVGRTARAGRAGQAISIVTQYDIQLFQRIEALIRTKMQELTIDRAAVLQRSEEVAQAQRTVISELKEKKEEKPEKPKKRRKTN